MKCYSVVVCAALVFSSSVALSAPPDDSRQNSESGPAATKEITSSLGMILVLIPSGEFLMGGSDTPENLAKEFPQYGLAADFFKDEQPQHRVRITKPFYFGKYEVTNGQFKQFVEATGYKTQAERHEDSRRGSGGWGFNQQEQKFEGRDPKYSWTNPGFPTPDNQPVVDVTWNDAVAFCDWRSKKESHKYRLPTEAEWEYAARGGSKTRYWNGDSPAGLAHIGNTADADFFAKFPTYYPKNKTVPASDGFFLAAPVGSFPANNFGLCDVHGNVWEWTNDWYAADYYANSPVDDPHGPADGGQKVRRGGAWHTAPLFTRLSFRNYNTVDSRYPNLGFRVVRDTDEK